MSVILPFLLPTLLATASPTSPVFQTSYDNIRIALKNGLPDPTAIHQHYRRISIAYMLVSDSNDTPPDRFGNRALPQLNWQNRLAEYYGPTSQTELQFTPRLVIAPPLRLSGSLPFNPPDSYELPIRNIDSSSRELVFAVFTCIEKVEYRRDLGDSGKLVERFKALTYRTFTIDQGLWVNPYEGHIGEVYANHILFEPKWQRVTVPEAEKIWTDLSLEPVAK